MTQNTTLSRRKIRGASAGMAAMAALPGALAHPAAAAVVPVARAVTAAPLGHAIASGWW